MSTDKSKDSVVFYYWAARGRGEQIRLALAEAGVTWEQPTFDITSEEEKLEYFAKCRELGKNLTTNIPMLYMDGKYLTQSCAILKYVARKYNLYPCQATTTEEAIYAAYDVDNLIEAAEDLRTANYKPMAMAGGTAEDIAAYKETILPKNLKNFLFMLGKRDYFAADGKFSVADLTIYDALDVANRQIPGVLDEYPALSEFHARIEARPSIAKWLASDLRAQLLAFPALE